MLPLFGRLSRSRAPAPDREAGGSAQAASRRRAASPAYSQPQSALSQNTDDDDEDDFEDAHEVLGPEPPPKIGLSAAGPATPRPADARTRLPLRAADNDQGRPRPAVLVSPPENASSRPLGPRPGSTYEVPTPAVTPADRGRQYETECDMCGTQERIVWFCNVCNYVFCGQCWDFQFVHKKVQPGSIPHEKTAPDIAKKIRNVLNPPIDDWIREKLYQADEVTAWFGIERSDDNAPPMFQDYGRFLDLMSSTDPIKNNPKSAFLNNADSLLRDTRTPSLVSFVGQTGAGKSTLVKLLVDFAFSGTEFYSTPVIGPRGAHLPTSEDVHLYLDPRTADSNAPLLYGDCEGLEGGEREPLGAMFKRKRTTKDEQSAELSEKMAKAEKIISEREIKWATETRSRSREFAVTNLYPRLLYTFSDVIVFVLRNPRVIEHVFERLIKWAAAAIETSSNQPVLPHAIIVLNASENDINPVLWDVPANTLHILEDLAHTVNKNDTFKKWAQFWRERGKPINTLEDLVLCYYTSIQILRVPAEGRPKIMQEQIEKLYQSTLTACIAARSARHRSRMLLDVDDLQNYLQEAFNHYSDTLEFPFDFVQASFRNSPIPVDFGGNILKLALNVMDIWKAENIDARRIFAELSYMVSSCIMLDSARHKNKGSASSIFPNYINQLDDALENFCDHHWPCEFVNPNSKVRCVNVRLGHTRKGHQSKDGKVFAAGDYASNFSFERHSVEFRNMVYACLVQLLEELTENVEDGEPEERAAAYIHRDMVLKSFFRHTAALGQQAKSENTLGSQTACFCCLFEQADHPLPCGHVLCTACVTTYGHARSPYEIELSGCPIDNEEPRRYSSWTIHLKPKAAGVRIMTLDGGGIRGVVELEVLLQIERAMGGCLPIQCFFDLIVGTSTGGLIALGLAAMNWRVEECMHHFENLCQEAFTRRTGGNIPLVGPLIDNYHHSKYQTTTLESSLKSVFPDDMHLFGGRRRVEFCVSPVKAVVTATSLLGNKTYVLANYNRPREGQIPSNYHFQRPERSIDELKIWEAARATSAAPRFFKPFHHTRSQKTFIDGAVFHNNPVRIADAERKLLWPDVDQPDILLSIGTGASLSLERARSEHVAQAKKGIVSHGFQLFHILKNNMEASLDCERIWDDFFASMMSIIKSPSIASTRYTRVNPEIQGSIPALDDKGKMGDLRRRATASLRHHPRISSIARHLIASSFYFELVSPVKETGDGRYLIQGLSRKLLCRFPQPSREVQEFGRHLKNRTMDEGSLSFVVWDDMAKDKTPKAIQWPDKLLTNMITHQSFQMGSVTFYASNSVVPTQMHLKFGDAEMCSISGFPRCLIPEPDPVARLRVATMPTIAHSSSTRYTHGSRRLKKPIEWKPPDMSKQSSITNLRQYIDPQRPLGFDVERERQAYSAMPSMPQILQGATPPPISMSTPTVPDSAPGNVRKAFRELLWPVRARPRDDKTIVAWAEDVHPPLEGFPENVSNVYDEENMSSMASAVQYYEVNPGELQVYEHWVNLLQPDRGRWMPPVSNEPKQFAVSSDQTYEVSGDQMHPAELPG